MSDRLEFARRHAPFIVALFAIAASITSLLNGFAYDDVRVILNNDRVHSLSEAWRFFDQKYWPPHDGDSLYRPLTILLFAVQWGIGGGSPIVFHVLSIALNACACVALFRVFRLVVKAETALIGSLLFAVHPVHTEAVANIVGQSELVVALLMFIAVERYIVAARSGRIDRPDIVFICGLYFAACLFKEHAIVLPGLLLAADAVVGGDRGSWRSRLVGAAPLALGLVMVGVAFVVLRTSVAGELRSGGVNELFSYNTPLKVRALTMLSVSSEWVRLFLWPAQLSADYSFPRTRLMTGPALSMLPGLLAIGAAAVLAWMKRRRAVAVTFGVLWLAVTLVIPSNLFIVTGFILAERTLYLPSAGVVLLGAIAVAQFWKVATERQSALRPMGAVAVGLLLICGIARSSTRNPVWANNQSLFRQTVLDVPLSSHAHWMLAEYLSKSGRRAEGAEEMEVAVMLGRKNDFVLLGVAADQLSEAGMCDRAMPLYERTLAIVPHNELWRSRSAACLLQLGRGGEARSVIGAGLARNPKSERLMRMRAFVDSVSSQGDSAASANSE